jgi:hypothetical protein
LCGFPRCLNLLDLRPQGLEQINRLGIFNRALGDSSDNALIFSNLRSVQRISCNANVLRQGLEFVGLRLNNINAFFLRRCEQRSLCLASAIARQPPWPSVRSYHRQSKHFSNNPKGTRLVSTI